MSVSLALVAALAVDPPDVVLVKKWEAPVECPAAAALQGSVRRSLAGLVLAGDARVQVSVRIESVGGAAARRYRLGLVLDVGDGPGERTLIAERCEVVVDTAAWLIALALDARAGDPARTIEAPALVPAPPVIVPPPAMNDPAADETGTPAPAQPANGTGMPARAQPAIGTPAPVQPANANGMPARAQPANANGMPARAQPANANGMPASGTGMPASGTGMPTRAQPANATGVPASETQSALGTTTPARGTATIAGTRPVPVRALHLDLWAGGGFGLGVLPAATAAASGGLALSGRHWQVELGGHYWARRSVALAREVGGRFAQGHASLKGCAAWDLGRVRLAPCGGLALGGLTAAGTGPVVSYTARSLWVGLLLGAQVWLRLHPRVRVGLQGDAVLGLRRPGFTLEPEGTLLFRPSAVGFHGLLALSIRVR